MRSILRYIPRKCRRLLIVCMLLTLTTLVLLSLHREIQNSEWTSEHIFEKVHDPFGSRHERKCIVQHYFKEEALADTHLSALQRNEERAQCFIGEDVNVDIQMEDVWDTVSIGYPNLILTVTGWLDTIQMSWTAKPLHVIVMPHSHQDPGWLQTVDSYFSGSTRHTLDLMVEKLTKNPTWTFIWAEVGLLQRWWAKATNTQKAQFLRLVKTGQLELVSGAWVMTDESVVHYGAMLDQLMEGHIWLKDHVNVTVENSWAIDPFGHSSTMAYLLGQSGVRNMIVQRTHFAVKRHMAKQKSFEFNWRQNWDVKGTADIFCHVMPFMLYGIPYSCGPNRHVCCKFDFYKKQCFYGKRRKDLLDISDNNVAELAKELWKQLQMKSELFRSNVLLMPHGDDFRYKTAEEWDKQFVNLEKIMDYINNNPEMQMKIEFGTLKDYFTYLHGSRDRPKTNTYPVLSGDLFPYSDRGEQYWSGFYSTRPHFKYLVRQLQHFLRSAEILFTFSVAGLNVNTNIKNLYSRLEKARQTLALSQHHDAITGTSKRGVMRDYSSRVQSALDDTIEVHKKTVSNILGKKTQKNIFVNITESFSTSGYFPTNVVCTLETPINLIIWNDVGQPRHELIHVVVDTPFVKVNDESSRPVIHQISPVWDKQRYINTKHYLLSLDVHIEAFSLSTFTVSAESVRSESKFAALYNVTDRHNNRSPPLELGLFRVYHIVKTFISVTSACMTAVFKTCDGMLYSVLHKDLKDTYRADTHFVTYSTGRYTDPFRDKSGAYTFVPDGAAKDVSEKPHVIVVEGSLFTEVRAMYKDIVHISRIYNISGVLNEIVHVENYVDISNKYWDNTELVMRIETSINSGEYFCTDSNGFQLHRRKTRSKMTIQGNFYPMTSAAILESDTARFTLLSSHSLGVASIVSGWLEVVLDRRLVQDDWRGLREGVTDNTQSKTSFYLLFEKKLLRNRERQGNVRYMCLQTFRSEFVADTLNSPLKVYSTKAFDNLQSTEIKTKLIPSLPCGWLVMNLRMLNVQNKVKESLITIHRRGLDCSYSAGSMTCLNRESLRWSDLRLQLHEVTETSLTGVNEIRKHQISDPLNVEPMQIKTYKIAFR
ncbi:alpha-mannosidase 2-like isoform X2 [Mercenaria mercenaria]|nr:alpha-mannosidase 2-like isoform X2 [Mercenaria mercenaria]